MLEVIILLTFSFAFFTLDLIYSLILLILLSILFTVSIFLKGLMTWGAILMLIVFLTGLFVVFTYIASSSPYDETKMTFFPSFFLFLICVLFFKKDEFFSVKFFLNYMDWSFGGIFFMIFLIFMIVFYMRSTYNKGGALRRKF